MRIEEDDFERPKGATFQARPDSSPPAASLVI